MYGASTSKVQEKLWPSEVPDIGRDAVLFSVRPDYLLVVLFGHRWLSVDLPGCGVVFLLRSLFVASVNVLTVQIPLSIKL